MLNLESTHFFPVCHVLELNFDVGPSFFRESRRLNGSGQPIFHFFSASLLILQPWKKIALLLGPFFVPLPFSIFKAVCIFYIFLPRMTLLEVDFRRRRLSFVSWKIEKKIFKSHFFSPLFLSDLNDNLFLGKKQKSGFQKTIRAEIILSGNQVLFSAPYKEGSNLLSSIRVFILKQGELLSPCITCKWDISWRTVLTQKLSRLLVTSWTPSAISAWSF